MTETIPTKQRLAKAIKEADPKLVYLIKKAEAGYYDDYESPIATPCIQLVADLRQAGLSDLAERAKNGEFDGAKEEGDAWFEKEGRALLNQKE